MNKTKKVIAAVVLLALVGFGGFWMMNRSDDAEKSTDNTTQQTQETVKPAITLSEDGKTVSYEGVSGKTALEVLKEGIDVETQSSDFGDFVTSINGVKADAAKEYWSFYVNGAYANEGAGTYKTTDGEKIEWKLESL